MCEYVSYWHGEKGYSLLGMAQSLLIVFMCCFTVKPKCYELKCVTAPHPHQIHMLKSQSPITQNVDAYFEERAFKGNKLK